MKHTNTGFTILNIFFFFSPSAHMLPNIFFPQHTHFFLFSILCLPCFNRSFFLLNPTNLPDPTPIFSFFSLQACTHYFFHSQLPKDWKQYLPHQVPMAIWIWCPPNYHPSTFDPIHDTHIGYFTFPASCDLSSGNDIGLHTIKLFLTFDSWLSLLTKM